MATVSDLTLIQAATVSNALKVMKDDAGNQDIHSREQVRIAAMYYRDGLLDQLTMVMLLLECWVDVPPQHQELVIRAIGIIKEYKKSKHPKTA